MGPRKTAPDAINDRGEVRQADLGDIAGVRGRAMRTKTGELSIEADSGGLGPINPRSHIE